MRLADPRLPEQDHVVSALDEGESGELAHDAPIDARLEVEIELIEGLDPGEARQLESCFDASELPPAPLGLERLAEEAPQIELLLRSLLAHAVELRSQVLHPHPLEQRHEFHDPTSS
jgi:hypothetical protein